MGSAIAYHLMKRDPGLDLVVVERDPSYTQASSALSVGNARVQFSVRQNIQISLHALEVFERFDEEMSVEGQRPDIRFRGEGNLFLHQERSADGAKSAMVLQQSLGCEVKWWSSDEIAIRHPFLETEGLAGGTFGRLDGHLDGYALLMGYKAKAASLGAKFVVGDVTEIVTEHGNLEGVRLESGENLHASVVVNCAGAWAADLSRTAGIDLPVVPVKRQAFRGRDSGAVRETPTPHGTSFGALLSKRGSRSTAGGQIPGRRPRRLQLSAGRRAASPIFSGPSWRSGLPAFERLRLTRGWAGLYAVNRLDGNAILGEWPDLKGLFHANGFSGHGLQQAPAAGRYLAELILGQEPTLDLAALGAKRIVEGRPLAEGGLV